LGQDLVLHSETSIDAALRKAVEATTEFIAASRSAATRKAYASDWRHFVEWAASGPLITLPARPETIATYLSALAIAEPPAKFSTIQRRVAAIAHAHREAGLDPPIAHPGVKRVLAGIAHKLGVKKSQKPAATAEIIGPAIRKIPRDLEGLRDRALLLIGFAAALRRSEIVGLNIDNITRHSKGAIVMIHRSKTDQAGAGVIKGVPFGRRLRPVAALDDWLGSLAAAGITEGPLFRGVHGPTILPRRLCAHQVNAIVKKRLGAQYGAHSLRSGYLSTASEHGASLQRMADHAGHAKLDTTRSYIQIADLFRDHSGRNFL
jgi:site-specific recombinase XerD